MTKTFSLAALSFSFLSSVASTPALAAPETRSRVVHFADLDLTSRAGERELRHRVSLAAREVCGGPDQWDFRAMTATAACRGAALAGADPKVRLALASAHSSEAYAARDVKVSHAAS